jgi:glutathione S-transferase
MLKQVPNALTILRFILIPFILISLINDDYISTFVLLTLSGLTDVLDGTIARKFNLMGKDDEENYEIESLMCCMEDIFSAMFKFTHLPENEKDKYDELRKVALERYKFFIKKIEERYIKHGKGKYFLGDRFTLCDILIGAQLPAFCDRFGEQVVPQVSPALTELITRLTEGELKEFHEKYFYKTQK